MNTIEPTKEQLNSFVLANHGSLQQSWQWGELQERMGRPVQRFLFDGAAATFVRHDLRLGKYYWLCPKGPVGKVENLESRISNLGGIFIRLEPEILNSSFVKAPKDHNPRATVIVDLAKGEDELLAAMHPKTRYNLRLAQKKGLRIENLESRISQEEFWELMQRTAKRDKVFLHPKRYYEELLKMEEVKLFGCYHEAKLIAAAMVSLWAEKAMYLHGASDYEYRAFMAPYLLHWEIMKQVKAAGCKYYDFGGVAPENEPGHFLAGISRFKSGWGGKYEEYAGSWDYVL